MNKTITVPGNIDVTFNTYTREVTMNVKITFEFVENINHIKNQLEWDHNYQTLKDMDSRSKYSPTFKCPVCKHENKTGISITDMTSNGLKHFFCEQCNTGIPLQDPHKLIDRSLPLNPIDSVDRIIQDEISQDEINQLKKEIDQLKNPDEVFIKSKITQIDDHELSMDIHHDTDFEYKNKEECPDSDIGCEMDKEDSMLDDINKTHYLTCYSCLAVNTLTDYMKDQIEKQTGVFKCRKCHALLVHDKYPIERVNNIDENLSVDWKDNEDE